MPSASTSCSWVTASPARQVATRPGSITAIFSGVIERMSAQNPPSARVWKTGSGDSVNGSAGSTIAPSSAKTFAAALDGSAHRRRRLGIAEGRRQRDALALERALRNPVAIGDAVIGEAVPVARVGALHRVEHQRRVGDGAGHRPDMRDVAKRRGRVDRDPAKGRLMPENAAERGRDADRAAGIGAHREGADAGEHRRGAAAAGPARTALQVPRVAGDAGERRVGGRLPAEFGGRGLAEKDRVLARAAGRSPARPHASAGWGRWSWSRRGAASRG